MAKTKSKDKYEARHLRNLTAYERQIDDIYREAVKEAASISSLVGGTSGDKAFSFKDYPITQHRVNKLLQGLKNSLYGTIVNAVRSEWTLANNKNNELCNQVFGSNVGMLSEAQYRRYYSTNPKALEAFIARKQQGLNLSDRVWNYTNQFKAEIEMGLDLGLRDGLSADEMSRQLRQYLRYPDKLFRRVRDEHGQLHLSKATKAFHPGQGVYRSSYKNARRLAATESNIAYRTADYDRYQNLDFVVGIEVHLSNNHTLNGKPFEDICDQLKGRYPKDFKFTGWHPLCRCHVTSVLKTREELFADNERIMRGEPVSTESVNSVDDVPQGFNKWLEENEERIARAKSLPYFMADNEKYCKTETIATIFEELSEKDYDAYMNKCQNLITQEEFNQIHNGKYRYVYSKNSFTINENIRMGTTPSADNQKTIDALNSAISKCYLEKDVTLTRFVDPRFLGFKFGMTNEDGTALGKYSDITDAMISSMQKSIIGKTFTENQFVSTSAHRDLNLFDNRKIELKINARKGTNCYAANNPTESEMILGIGHKFKVKGIQKRTDIEDAVIILVDLL